MYKLEFLPLFGFPGVYNSVFTQAFVAQSKIMCKDFLVAQWLIIRLPVQGTQVQALVWEDPICRGATKPVRHNYQACALEPASQNY